MTFVSPDNAAALVHIAWRGQSSIDWGGLDPDVDALVGEIEEHRLAGRAHVMLDRLEAPWVGTDLRVAVDELRRSVEVEAGQHRQVLAELAAVEGGDGNIVIKGMSSAELLKDPTMLRCGDIDSVPRDVDQFIGHLFNLGFERTRDPMVHEAGEFTRDDVSVDVQTYFPIYSLPPALAASSRRGGEILCGDHMTHERITFDILHASRVDRRFSVAGPEVSALLMGAHAFMNFCNVWSISHREKSYLRLGELADVRELRCLPTFDRTLAATLEQELLGSDASGWVDWVLGALPRSFDGGSEDTLYPPVPRCLWWDLWYDLPTSASQLLGRWWLNMGEVVRALPHQRMEVGCPARSQGGPSIGFGYAAPSVTCTVRGGADASIAFDIEVETAGDAQELRIRFDAGSAGVDIVLDRANATAAVTGDPLGVNVGAAGADVAVTVVLPRALLVERGVSSGLEGVFVGAATASGGRATSGTALALVLDL